MFQHQNYQQSKKFELKALVYTNLFIDSFNKML